MKPTELYKGVSLNSAVIDKKQISFRKDINSLRSVAVLSVLFYHFGVLGFSGGFAGVDVFFVISGFLMTGIVYGGLQNDRFSVFDFYIARIQRILPALTVLCTSVLALCWFILAPDDYVRVAKHARDTLLFISNETYRNESGYFDSDSHEKWLLHTWSLSIEWQFYLLLPVFMSIVWFIKKNTRLIVSVICVLCVVSFISCVVKTGDSASKAFYLLKYRYWELLAGSVVFFAARSFSVPELLSRIAFYAGLILIVFSVFFFEAADHWPGWRAGVPVIGSMAVIFSARQSGWFCNAKVLQWVGDRSYSLYLWHWPVVVALAYFQKTDSVLWVAAGIAMSFAFAAASYLLVEIPCRVSGVKSRRLLALVLLVFAAMVISIAQWVVHNKGLSFRVSHEVAAIRSEQNNVNKRGSECVADNRAVPPQCIYGGNEIKAIVLGDSHANTIVTAAQSAMHDPSHGVYYWGHLACPFIVGVKDYVGCAAFNEWALAELKKIPKDIPLIIISRLSYYALGGNEGRASGGRPRPPVHFSREYDESAPEFLEEFRKLSLQTYCEAAKTRDVYILMPIPELQVNVPQVLARAAMTGNKMQVKISRDDYYSRHRFILDVLSQAEKNCGVKVLDPLPYLCDQQYCYGDKNGWPLYFDDDHLSESGNKLLVPLFSSIIYPDNTAIPVP